MKGKKSKIIIISTLFVALSVAVVVFFLLVVSFSNRSPSIVNEEYGVKPLSYQYLHYDPKSGESTVGMTKSLQEIEELESVFYQDVKGNYVLISNFGSEVYFCSGTCSCVNHDENSLDERRVVNSGSVAVRGVIYLVAAVTSYVAIHKAKEYYEEECVHQLSETCVSPTSTIISEVETCEKGTDDPSMSQARFGSLGDAFRTNEETKKKLKEMKDKAVDERKKKWEERNKQRNRNPPKQYKKPQRARPQQRKDQSRYVKPEQRVQEKVQEKSQPQQKAQQQVETKVKEEPKTEAKVGESKKTKETEAERIERRIKEQEGKEIVKFRCEGTCVPLNNALVDKGGFIFKDRGEEFSCESLRKVGGTSFDAKGMTFQERLERAKEMFSNQFLRKFCRKSGRRKYWYRFARGNGTFKNIYLCVGSHSSGDPNRSIHCQQTFPQPTNPMRKVYHF